MTEFERQVAEALAMAMGAQDAVHAKRLHPDEGAVVWDHAVDLAPHVAAAITAACATYEPYAPDFTDVAEGAALAALRGSR